MTHCGCVDFLIVFILRIVIVFLWVLRIIIILLLKNINIIIISFKTIFPLIGLDWEIIVSIWNLFFILLVLLISLSVLFFSISYITNLRVKIFMYLYLSFVFRMCWLIVNNRFYWIILGWDGLGVVSFLLIIFYQNYERSSNALFTLFQNRVGDLFFVFFLVLVLNYSIISSFYLISFSILVLMVGAVVKSAQFPFNAWLLAAIRAPTPISSLVHSSTLVVAGVYILLQYSYCLIEYNYILKFISVRTLILSLFGLLIETDMKKLIANSTISHVGLMVFLAREGLYKIAYFHLNIHAMFKSIIFICFGFVILVSHHSQDYRLISFFNLIPITKFAYIYACLCLIGLPFLSAFFSKDFILEKWVEWTNEVSFFFILLRFIGVRIYYSIKLLFLKDYFLVWARKESFLLGSLRVITIIIVRVAFVNVIISYVFSISLEIVSVKFIIYLIVLMYVLLCFISKFFYKWWIFEKSVLIYELFNCYFFRVEIYAYRVLSEVVKLSSVIISIKKILLVNWWVVVILVCFI